jgi:hypothetical protein
MVHVLLLFVYTCLWAFIVYFAILHSLKREVKPVRMVIAITHIMRLKYITQKNQL